MLAGGRTMVNVFGQSTEKVGERGAAGPAGSSNLKELIKWFPQLTIEQIRKNVNFCTFLVETLPPDEDWDVKLSEDKRVTAWRSFNRSPHGKKILTPIGKGSILEKLLPAMSVHQRYGLKFERTEQCAYYANNITSLRVPGSTVVLTITFLVGALPPDNVASDGEEFILNDYNPEEQTAEHFRGISISSTGEEKFDLFLHGADASGSNSAASKNRLKIGTSLQSSWFYTVQVKWGAQIERPDGSVRRLDSSYAIYENNECLVEKTFRSPLLREQQTLAFSLGAKKALDKTADNYFTGTLSNVEILETEHETIPKELLHFIAMKQILINDHLLLAPTSKRQKKM